MKSYYHFEGFLWLSAIEAFLTILFFLTPRLFIDGKEELRFSSAVVVPLLLPAVLTVPLAVIGQFSLVDKMAVPRLTTITVLVLEALCIGKVSN